MLAVVITGEQSVIAEQQHLAAAEIPDTSGILVPVQEKVITLPKRDIDFGITFFSDKQRGLVSLESVRHMIGFTDSQRRTALLVHSVPADAVMFQFLLHLPNQVQQIQIGQGRISESFPALV